jgi:lipopolysaccharide export system protein LptA
VIVAVAIVLVQLRGVFFAQTKLAEATPVVVFSDDLETIVNKAIAITGNVVFTYHPVLKQYTVRISDNTVTVFDKLSKKSSSFSKSMHEIVGNYFEDKENITIIKRENKIYILGS